MATRLGNVIYWLGCVIAALILAADAAEWFGEAQYRSDGLPVVLVIAVAAAIVWVIGRAFRYVLAGR
jgi:hypothetical protein